MTERDLATNLERRRRIAALYERSRRHFPEVSDITADELHGLRETERVVVVDVRKPAEQAVSMIPGAVSSRHFEDNARQFEGATIVTYCTIGHRSGLYARRLHAAGWRVRNLRGSILAWTHAGGTLESGAGATRRVHVAGRRWSLEAAGYEPVW